MTRMYSVKKLNEPISVEAGDRIETEAVLKIKNSSTHRTFNVKKPPGSKLAARLKRKEAFAKGLRGKPLDLSAKALPSRIDMQSIKTVSKNDVSKGKSFIGRSVLKRTQNK